MHFNSINAPPPLLQSWTEEIDLTWLSLVSFGNLSSTVLLLVRLLDKEKRQTCPGKRKMEKNQIYQSTVSHVNNLRTLYPPTEYLFLTNLLSCLPTCSSQHCRCPCWDQSLRSSPWDSRRPANICILLNLIGPPFCKYLHSLNLRVHPYSVPTIWSLNKQYWAAASYCTRVFLAARSLCT